MILEINDIKTGKKIISGNITAEITEDKRYDLFVIKVIH